MPCWSRGDELGHCDPTAIREGDPTGHERDIRPGDVGFGVSGESFVVAGVTAGSQTEALSRGRVKPATGTLYTEQLGYNPDEVRDLVESADELS
jgi:hypothetical protein